MAITVEYGKCGKCGDNNVKTAQLCRACDEPLPWSRLVKESAAALDPNRKTGPKIDVSMGFSKGFYVQILGGLVVAAGALLMVAGVVALGPVGRVFGRIAIGVGGLIWGSGAAMDKHGANF